MKTLHFPVSHYHRKLFQPMPSPPHLQSSPRIFLRAWARAVPALGVLIQVLGEKPQEDRRRSEARPHIRRCSFTIYGTNTKRENSVYEHSICVCLMCVGVCVCVSCVSMCVHACVHVCCLSACVERNIAQITRLHHHIGRHRHRHRQTHTASPNKQTHTASPYKRLCL
jgi:hypothetical protein